MRRCASSGKWTRAGAILAAALVSLCAAGETVRLGGDGPLLPRPSGPRSSPVLVAPTEETVVPSEQSEVIEATGTEDEREAAAPQEAPSTLRAFLDEMLEQGALWKVLPLHMGVEARRMYLEDRSIRCYREGIARFPRSALAPRAHLKIAAIYARRGDTRTALREYATLLEHFPKDECADEARLGRARLMFEADDYAGARRESYLLIDCYPESPLVTDAYLLAARAQELLGEHDAAKLAYSHVVNRTPPDDERHVRAREGLASVDLAKGNTTAAAYIYKELLAQAPTQAERDARQFKLARIYLDAGETVRGRTLLRRILDGYALNAFRASAAFLLADSYYAEGKMPQAARYYTNALLEFSSTEGRIPALFRAANAYRELGLYEDALALMRQVPKEHAPAATAHERGQAKLIAGELLILDGNCGAALEELYGALVGELTAAERNRAAYRIAQCYYRSGYYNEALEAFDAALEQAPHHELAPMASEALADCYAKKGWLDEARQRYTAIIEGGSDDDTPAQLAMRSRVVFRLLNTYSDQNLYQEELNCASKLREHHYAFLDEARLLYRMARAYEHLNNPAQAEALYTAVRSQFPESAWAERAAVKLRHVQMLRQIEALATGHTQGGT